MTEEDVIRLISVQSEADSGDMWWKSRERPTLISETAPYHLILKGEKSNQSLDEFVREEGKNTPTSPSPAAIVHRWHLSGRKTTGLCVSRKTTGLCLSPFPTVISHHCHQSRRRSGLSCSGRTDRERNLPRGTIEHRSGMQKGPPAVVDRSLRTAHKHRALRADDETLNELTSLQASNMLR